MSNKERERGMRQAVLALLQPFFEVKEIKAPLPMVCDISVFNKKKKKR